MPTVKKYNCVILFFLLFCWSCSYQSKEKQLGNAIQQLFNLDMIEIVYSESNELKFKDIRDKYRFIKVVYLQVDCKPCYPKFIEWHKKLADMAIPDDFSVLFVIQGHSYESFMRQVRMIEDIDNRYCVIMDPNYEFIDANSEIPHWIIDASILRWREFVTRALFGQIMEILIIIKTVNPRLSDFVF
jgi:hypothetical protein